MSAALVSPHELFAALERRGLACARARMPEHDTKVWRAYLLPELEVSAAHLDPVRGWVIPAAPAVLGRPA